jgi:hypothetical protein
MDKIDKQLFDAAMIELAEGHLELDRHGIAREAERGDFIEELPIAERITLLLRKAK